jgi:L-asparaginase type I
VQTASPETGGANGTAAGPAQPQQAVAAARRHLPRVLMVHTGGTLGMDPARSYQMDPEGHLELKQGTGGEYLPGLQPSAMLANVLTAVPELGSLAQIDLKVVFNKDSSNVVPEDWVALAQLLDAARDDYAAAVIVHGTDTMAYTASALSFMLAGYGKPIVLTGSQIPLAMPRSDARQNLIDSLTCAVASHAPPHVALQEVSICFGGRLLRGNRATKWNSTLYQAFDSPSYPALASLGVEIEWAREALLQGGRQPYTPRLALDPRVMRVPIVPGSDPRVAYGDLYGRGVRGVVLEAFGVGNMPDQDGWLEWLAEQRQRGLQVYLRSQSSVGALRPELYRAGATALRLGVQAGPQLTAESAVAKMMLCLKFPEISLATPLAGEV